jgi:hypothetical protein
MEEKKRNDLDKNWQDFVEESKKLLAKEETETKTKIFDAIMDVKLSGFPCLIVK